MKQQLIHTLEFPVTSPSTASASEGEGQPSRHVVGLGPANEPKIVADNTNARAPILAGCFSTPISPSANVRAVACANFRSRPREGTQRQWQIANKPSAASLNPELYSNTIHVEISIFCVTSMYPKRDRHAPLYVYIR
jgi:hypothetical protein